ncbi:ABC transporter ATP-binding protein [Sneathiella litorea]|uniref:ATP-binding cassette domain-containing protein n=1 Tax=Sneathiella litorea TaxID=2606216 RepID=A0A6L8W9R5_9PROT|nr:ABC transporter ATP-binding protein [Sneathiella litorea]MZR31274.1 ATP-binding cassette domain-containing protein [Sneathiella litorea]
MSEQSPALELRRINKSFGPVHANKDISLSVDRGTIHGIVGENGAGKSTLMSIVYGFYQADSGDILVNGKTCRIENPQSSIEAGIGMVHQHFMLVDTFTVLENIILGIEGGYRLKEGLSAARKELVRLEKEYALEVDVDAIVGDLPVGLRQRVEILKALYRGAEILILDEPTGVLTPQEADHLFRILDTLREQGKTVILITHKLREIMAITDNVSVMRRGEMVAHVRTGDTSQAALAELMVGRSVLLHVEKETAAPKETLLAIRNLNYVDIDSVPRLKNINLDLRAGEILGIAGVSGNGQSELLEVLGGMLAPTSGSIKFKGQELVGNKTFTARNLRKIGLGHVPEDRHRSGLVLPFSANECSILGYHDKPEYNRGLQLDRNSMVETCNTYIEKYDVRPPDPYLKASGFSGGNQQKLVLAREMEQNPDVLLVGQPTRGVDIGAIEFIHKQLIKMRDAGKAILVVSVEIEEVMSLADRIAVMFDGGIVGELPAAEATETQLGLMMTGVREPKSDAKATI